MQCHRRHQLAILLRPLAATTTTTTASASRYSTASTATTRTANISSSLAAAAAVQGAEHKNSTLGYSRRDVISSLHAAARLSPSIPNLRTDDLAHCTVIRLDGSIERNRPLSKSTLIDEYGLQARDLRALDSHILDVRPCLLVRTKAIVFVSPIFRSVITFDRMLILGVDQRKPVVSEQSNEELVEAIAAMIQTEASTGVSFELRALEAMLIICIRGFQQVVHTLQRMTHQEIIPDLRLAVAPQDIARLLELKRAVDDCVSIGRSLQSAVSGVLSEDEDLAALYLTDKFNNSSHAVNDHQTAELMLEHVERRIDEVNESAIRLSSLLKNLDSNISLVLQSTRLKLQNLELQTAIGALSFASGTAVASFFGQNLVSGLETTPNAFWISTSFGIFSMVALGALGFLRLARAKRSQITAAIVRERSVVERMRGIRTK